MFTCIRSIRASRIFQGYISNALSNDAQTPSGAPLWVHHWPILFLLVINKQTSELQIFCGIFADDTRIGGKTIDGEIIQPVLVKMAEWAARNGIVLAASKI